MDRPIPTNLLPKRHYRRLTERLHAFMEEQHFQSGDRLPSERALAEKFGVSRSSIREAIRGLSEKGLLESRQGDGTYVCGMIASFPDALVAAVDAEGLLFDEVIEFRSMLEPTIAALAATRRSQEQLNRLKVISCDQHRRAQSREEDGDLDAAFHLLLAECTGNPLFIEATKQLNTMFANGRSPDVKGEILRDQSLSDHLAFIDALEQQSSDDARNIAEKHLEHILAHHLFIKARDSE